MNKIISPKPIHNLTYDQVMKKWGLSNVAGQVGDGWAVIIDQMCTELIEKGWQPTYTSRIVERFGKLDITVRLPKELTANQCDEIAAEVQLAQSKAQCTCEECGRPGETRKSLFELDKTWCDSCWLAERAMGGVFHEGDVSAEEREKGFSNLLSKVKKITNAPIINSDPSNLADKILRKSEEHQSLSDDYEIGLE